MEIGLKDGAYIAVYLITVISLWNGFHNDIVNNVKDIKSNSRDIQKLRELFEKVMFSETGELLFVTGKQCNETKTEMRSRFEKGKTASEKALSKIDKMDKNVMLIMYHLNIQPTNAEKTLEQKS